MATIKEMADTQYPFKFSGSKSIFDKKRTEGFIDGANAVLEEIEFLYQHCRDYQLYHLLGLKIKQLKGE